MPTVIFEGVTKGLHAVTVELPKHTNGNRASQGMEFRLIAVAST